MLQVSGPAVADVLATFVERWNDPTPVDHRNPYRRLRQRAAHMPRHAAPITDVPPPPPAAGSHAVQVLRTYPAKRPSFPFAPHGERTVARAYEHVFARATELVYIEDQYLWSTSVAGALARALRSTPSLHVIAVVPRFPDADGRLSGPPNRLGQLAALRMLTQAGGDRFGVYDVENDAGTPIYVHAKVCIVDDAWMSCGSDNFNRRSWTHDSELTCGVVDPDGELPRRLRIRLWAEHLGLADRDPRLDDLTRAGDLWRQRAGAVGCRTRVHRPAPVSSVTRLWAHPLQRLVFDPDGRPIRLRLHHRF
jgi:phosphatidylserine/phosphatidylglycerophosphate/cardiolipin synthase-like enzyme